MEIIFQDLEWSLPTIKKMAMKNAGLSHIFKTIRGQERFYYIGDIPIFSFIVTTIAKIDITKNRSELTYALRKIEEYRDMSKIEKMKFLDELYNFLYAIKKDKRSSKKNKKGGSGH